MRLTIFLLTVVFSHIYASGSAQSVTLSGNALRLQEVFTAIEKQTGYYVLYSDALMAAAKPVTVTAKQLPLEQFLKTVFAAQPSLTFTIKGKSIFILAKAPEVTTASAYKPKVRIRVTDATGNALSGASVAVKNGRLAGVTDAAGLLSIEVAEGDVLLVSYVGFETRSIPVSASAITAGDLTIALTPAVAKLDAVQVTVNTGYQNISRERMPGSFSSVQVKRLESKLQPSLLTALEGQAAGVVVTNTGKLEIRGRSTFLANSDPLIVVDGYPISGGLETVNIDNIESITVLKDAVAASIYGARSSNGVVVITTKSGKKGKMQIGYKGSTGIVSRPNLSYLDRTSSSDYVDAEIETYENNITQAQTNYDRSTVASRVYQLLIGKDRGLITEKEMNTELDQLRKNDGIGQLQQYLFRPKIMQQHNISLSSGSEKNMTNAAIRFIGNQNNTIGNSDNRVIFDLKNDWKPSRRVTIRVFSNINFSNSTAPVRSASDLLAYSGGMLQPYSLVADPATGNPQDVPVVRPELIAQYAAVQGLKPVNYNPLNDLLQETTHGQNFQARLGGSINVAITDDLSAEVGGAWTRGSGFSRTLYSADAWRSRSLFDATTSATNPTKHYVPDGAMVDEYRNINEAYTFRGQLNFNKSIGSKHTITAIAGSEINKDVLDNNTYPLRFGYNDQAGTFVPFNYADYNQGLYNADFLFPGGSSSAGNGSYSFRDNRFVSLYANGSYEYDNRFIVSASARIDQTNFFGTNPKYRYKPNWSVGGTYKLGEEKFFQAAWIDKLNIRASYGINGNVSLKQGPYLLVQAGNYSPVTGAVTSTISSPPNKDLRWERTLITNIGVDLGLFNHRLTASLDFYNKLSKDLLAPDYIDATYGRTSLTRNAGEARNTGIELSLESDVVKTNTFNWNVYFNGSYNKSRVLQFNYDYRSTTLLRVNSASLFPGSTGGVLRMGYPLDAVFSFPFAGISNTGASTYYTADKDIVAGTGVKVDDMVYSGTLRPNYVMGLTNTFSYARFDLSFMFVTQLGGVLRRDIYAGTSYENKYVAQRWRKPGDEAHTIYPKLTVLGNENAFFPYADINVRSSNYLKLRDLSLAYTLDNKIWGHTGLNNVKVYFQGRNLWLITANEDHIDPETITLSDSGTFTRSIPLKPEFYLGLSVNF